MPKKSYYDFDVDFEAILIENALLDECFRLKDLQNRKLYLNMQELLLTLCLLYYHNHNLLTDLILNNKKTGKRLLGNRFFKI